MKDLRLVEHYSSIEGEGPRTGVPTQFVRFAGCNLRCPLWPCDTPYAINPEEWMANSYVQSPTELVEACGIQRSLHGAKNIALTGGEPFIQPIEALHEFVIGLWHLDYTIEVFTNGTRILPPWALRYLQINMDWKLDGSGEGQKFHDERISNVNQFKPTDMIKFVCANRTDFHQAISIIETLRHMTHATLWMGVAWEAVYSTAELVEDMQKYPELPLNLNVQVHKYIWPAAERGV